MRHHELEGVDLRLPQLIVSPQVGRRIESGRARLMILPFRPQPTICAATLGQFGLDRPSEQELLEGVRQAFSMGQILPPIAPIRTGYAFEFKGEFVPEKLHNFGTGIVLKMGITRHASITSKHLRLCGFSNQEDFNVYWHQAAADLSEHKNPWCWLIEFTFKG